LQKEEVVNLYDHEMNSLKGGTSPLTTSSGICSGLLIDAVTIVGSLISYAYENYQENKNKTNALDNYFGKITDCYVETCCSCPTGIVDC
jgi:hypothetical protein